MQSKVGKSREIEVVYDDLVFDDNIYFLALDLRKSISFINHDQKEVIDHSKRKKITRHTNYESLCEFQEPQIEATTYNKRDTSRSRGANQSFQ